MIYCCTNNNFVCEEVKFLKIKRNKRIIAISILLLLALTLIITFLILCYRYNNEIDLSLLRTGASSVTKIYYFENEDRKNRIGEPIELKDEAIFLQKSEWESLYSMPKHLSNAFIAIEDKRFFQHHGIDLIRTSKAVLNYIFKFDKSGYGGSTITQQLIKNLTGDNETTPKRKIEEIFRAINLEKRLGKNEILEMYLNVVYLSQNSYGVASASELYFNKGVNELTLAECASLASIVQNPSKYDPYKNPQNNKDRRKVVLMEMLSQGMINEREYNEAILEEINLNKNIENENKSGVYSWYTEALINDVSEDISTEYKISKDAARRLILKGGLNIYSTIDPSLQNKLEEIYESYVAYVPNNGGKYPQSSCVIIDPESFDVLALVGGTGEKEGNLLFNRAINAKRPPGSVLKPLSVYAPGIEENIFNYSTVYDDVPLVLENGRTWPKNSPNKYRGLIPIYFAVEHSVNTVAVKALNDLGINSSMNYLRKFGVSYDGKMDNNESSLALGQLTNGESLLNITNAYTAFANGGYIGQPKTYLYVTDNFGNIILERKDEKNRVISEQSAYITTKLLENVVNSGTASFVKSKDIVSIAGKTGTSSNNEDKWFVGYTPSLVCGVWTGYDTPAPMYYSKNPSCIIFDEIISFAYSQSDDKLEFKRPDNIIEMEFCFDSGLKPSDKCDLDIRGERCQMGFYKTENAPKEHCEIHKLVEIDAQDGLIAKKFTPFWRKRKASLLDYTRPEFEGIVPLDNDYLIKTRKREELQY